MRSPTARRGAAIARPRFAKVFLLEIAALFAISLLLGLIWGIAFAISMLLGGMIALIPQAYFTYQAFRFSGARAARQVSQAFYRGEAGKFILNLVLFAAVFMFVDSVNVLALFAGYIFVLLGNWMGAASVIRHRSN
ncbi:ATP synthase protein I [Sinobacterium caligoides]|uniref:ATP synthase protein I n=1 Tax=Sinobacterium caligoides TaxID=933926 RepID=A0A3N2DGV8_9GAMM|nr:ATP synthase subunit I [Sinobacterium caligoides]ROR99037.1 ATP synthase protein I [Sinobacterium caligoides]